MKRSANKLNEKITQATQNHNNNSDNNNILVAENLTNRKTINSTFYSLVLDFLKIEKSLEKNPTNSDDNKWVTENSTNSGSINSTTDLLILLFQEIEELLEKNPTKSIQQLIITFEKKHSEFLAEKKLIPVITFEAKSSMDSKGRTLNEDFKNSMDFCKDFRENTNLNLPDCLHEGLYYYTYDKIKDQLKSIFSFPLIVDEKIKNANLMYPPEDPLAIPFFAYDPDGFIVINQASYFLEKLTISYHNYNQNNGKAEQRFPKTTHTSFPEAKKISEIYDRLSDEDQLLLFCSLTFLEPGKNWFTLTSTEPAMETTTTSSATAQNVPNQSITQTEKNSPDVTPEEGFMKNPPITTLFSNKENGAPSVSINLNNNDPPQNENKQIFSLNFQ